MNLGKIVGCGNTATVYDWEKGTVIKLFNPGYPIESVEREYHNAVVLREKNLTKPMVYDMVTVDNRPGIIYEKLQGETLLDVVLRTYKLQECAEILAQLHKEILQNTISDVPHYKDFLQHNLERVSFESSEEKDEIFAMLQDLPDGDILCHGDFCPGNVIITPEKPIVIDFMNICAGDYFYDVARTVYLIQYTPVPPVPGEVKALLKLKEDLANAYLKCMNVTREQISKYLPVIIASRAGE